MQTLLIRDLLILLFYSRQKSSRMATKKGKNQTQLIDTRQSRFRSSDINLNGQILRIRTVECSKSIQNIWFLDQSQICSFFQNYNKLPLSKIDAKQLFTLQGTRIIKNQNKIYLGQIQNKKKHGFGIAVYKDGRIFQGMFCQNDKNGHGCELYSNGNLYIGSFTQNKKHGKGSFYWFSLCTPACTKQSNPKIQQYHGDWWGGLPDGQGQHQKSNGDFYIGGFKNGLKHGDGVQYYANGDIYKGQYINGLAEGFGQYSWVDGSHYKGDFKQGYRNGYGVWESKNKKEIYKGHYLLDRKHGYGVYDWGNNTIYKGHYLQDLRMGHGQLYRNGQLVYEGLWQNGERAQFSSQLVKQKKLTQNSRSKSKSKSKQKDLNSSSNINFRVKTSKIKYKSTEKRNSMAETIKKDHFQINVKLLDSSRSHRGCMACCNKRPVTGIVTSSKSIKFRRRNKNFQNPEEFAY